MYFSVYFTVVLTVKYTLKVTISMREIVGGVVRYRDLVTKIKITKFFSWRVYWWFAKICARENFSLYGGLHKTCMIYRVVWIKLSYSLLSQCGTS